MQSEYWQIWFDNILTETRKAFSLKTKKRPSFGWQHNLLQNVFGRTYCSSQLANHMAETLWM